MQTEWSLTVAQNVAGSSPVSHPIFFALGSPCFMMCGTRCFFMVSERVPAKPPKRRKTGKKHRLFKSFRARRTGPPLRPDRNGMDLQDVPPLPSAAASAARIRKHSKTKRAAANLCGKQQPVFRFAGGPAEPLFTYSAGPHRQSYFLK